jgi:hypothetical protein
MKKQIKTYKLERVEVNSSEIEIPEEPMYVFQTGIRRAIRIVPEWTTWNKEHHGTEEEIWRLVVTCVYNSFECKIECYDIQVSQIEDMIRTSKDTYSIPNMLMSGYYGVRTKEQFDADLQMALDKIMITEQSMR